jgi:triosephosphate isomerase
MKRNRMLLVANWKMNVTSEKEALNLFNSIKNVIARLSGIEMVVCPPHMYLNQVSREVISDHYITGAQDAFPIEEGNFTGETSIKMVKNAGAKYVILGHSERNEDKIDVSKKIIAALDAQINPIICIGEKERSKNWKKEIQQQLRDVFNRVSKKYPERIVIAYCPEWAIYQDGKKNPATAEQYNEAMDIIKKELQKIFKTFKAVESMRFIYGGSLDDKNIEEYFKSTDVEGFIVGRVSHDPRILMTMFRLIQEGISNREKALREAELLAE